MAKRKQSQKKTKSMGKIYHKETVIDGIKFDSKTESEYYEYLIHNKAALDIKTIELQPKFLLQEKYILAKDGRVFKESLYTEKEFKKLQREFPGCTVQPINYIADFKITYNDNTIDIVDVKGIKTADFKLKEKMFNFKYPEYGGLVCMVKYYKRWMTWENKEQLQRDRKKNGSKK